MAVSPSFSTYFNSLKIIHLGLQLGPLLFLAIIHFALIEPASSDAALGEVFRYLIPAFAVMIIFSGRIITNKMLQVVKGETDLEKKLMTYRSVSIVRWTLVEGITLFAVVGYFLTGLPTLSLVALALSAYFFTLRPTPELLITELELNHQDRSAILGR